MRYREPFCVYPRKLKTGRVVYYYQTYDAEGRRTNPRSTGSLNGRGARAYCMKLYKAGTLGVPEKDVPTMAEFSVGWWDKETCEYLKSRMARRKISTSYAREGKRILEQDILPTFGRKRLDAITSHDVDMWMVSYVGRGRAGESVNKMFAILKIMLDQAVRKGLVRKNPCNSIQRVAVAKRKVELFTPDEVRRLFSPNDVPLMWEDHLHYTANMLSATTGLRLGEVLGLKGQYVFGDYVEVCAQYTSYHEYTETKTHDVRIVTIPSVVSVWLSRLKEINGDGFLFATDGGIKPVSRSAIYKHFQHALARIGVDREAQVRRNLTFHKWRHFFNTTLRMGDVADSKVRKLTGHRSEAMTELYTHFDSRSFTDVRRIQEGIISGRNGESFRFPCSVAE